MSSKGPGFGDLDNLLRATNISQIAASLNDQHQPRAKVKLEPDSQGEKTSAFSALFETHGDTVFSTLKSIFVAGQNAIYTGSSSTTSPQISSPKKKNRKIFTKKNR